MFEFGEDTAAVVITGFYAGLRAHSLKLCFLSIRKFLRNIDHDIDQFIAGTSVFRIRKTFAAKTQHLARLCACRDIHTGSACNRRNFNSSSKSGSRNVEHQIIDYIGTVANKFRMLDFLDHYKKIAGDTSTLGIVTFAAERECLSFLSSCRYRETYFYITTLDTFAVAIGTTFGDDFSSPVACRAYDSSASEAELCELIVLHMALTMAGGTCSESHAILGSCTLAVIACHERRNPQSLVYTLGYILKGELDTNSEIRSTTLTTLLTTTAGSSAKTSEATEFLGKTTQDIVEIHTTGAVESTGASTRETLWPHRMTVLVIHLAFFLVAQHIVRLGRFLEFFLSGLVAWITVGVILEGKLSVCLFYLVGCGVAADAEHFIIITFFSHNSRLFAHSHLGVAEDFVIEHITLLSSIYNLAFEIFRRRGNCRYRLVKIWVEIGTGAVHYLHTLALEVFYELIIDQLHSLADSLGRIIGSRSHQAAFEIIDYRQESEKHTLGCVLEKIGFLTGNTFTIVIELGHKEKILFLFFLYGSSGLVEFVLKAGIFLKLCLCHIVIGLVFVKYVENFRFFLDFLRL